MRLTISRQTVIDKDFGPQDETVVLAEYSERSQRFILKKAQISIAGIRNLHTSPPLLICMFDISKRYSIFANVINSYSIERYAS